MNITTEVRRYFHPVTTHPWFAAWRARDRGLLAACNAWFAYLNGAQKPGRFGDYIEFVFLGDESGMHGRQANGVKPLERFTHALLTPEPGLKDLLPVFLLADDLFVIGEVRDFNEKA